VCDGIGDRSDGPLDHAVITELRWPMTSDTASGRPGCKEPGQGRHLQVDPGKRPVGYVHFIDGHLPPAGSFLRRPRRGLQRRSVAEDTILDMTLAPRPTSDAVPAAQPSARENKTLSSAGPGGSRGDWRGACAGCEALSAVLRLAESRAGRCGCAPIRTVVSAGGHRPAETHVFSLFCAPRTTILL